MNCPKCKGKGKYDVSVTEHGSEGEKKSSFPMKCDLCEGTGETTQAHVDAVEKAHNDFWCSCGNPSGDASYYEEGGSHGWACNDCGKVVQVG